MLSLQLRRLRYRRQLRDSALSSAWEAPLPRKNCDWREVPFLVCDAEMSSLEPDEGELLSIGWVLIDKACIQLASARHHLIQASNSVGQSATIHQLRDCELDDAETEAEVLEKFLAAASGRVLVFHNALLDLAYLDRSCLRHCGAPLLLPSVDTMTREHARLRHADATIQPGDLRLQACRDRYNLPAYPAHNALVDALATAELLMAQTRHRGGSGKFPLKNLL